MVFRGWVEHIETAKIIPCIARHTKKQNETNELQHELQQITKNFNLIYIEEQKLVRDWYLIEANPCQVSADEGTEEFVEGPFTSFKVRKLAVENIYNEKGTKQRAEHNTQFRKLRYIKKQLLE